MVCLDQMTVGVAEGSSMKKLFAFVGALYVGMAAWIVPVVGIWTYGWILQRLEQ